MGEMMSNTTNKFGNKIPLDDLIILCEATHTDLDYFFRPLRKLNKKLYINGRNDE